MRFSKYLMWAWVATTILVISSVLYVRVAHAQAPKVGSRIGFYRTCVMETLPDFVPYLQEGLNHDNLFREKFRAKQCQLFRGGAVREILTTVGSIDTPTGIRWVVIIHRSSDGRVWYALTDAR